MSSIAIFLSGAGAATLIIFLLYKIVFSNVLTSQQKEMIINYLIYAVSIAEQTFGAGTGKLKFAKVYNNFVTEMPNLAKIISYEEFSSLVDIALQKMRDMMNNQSIEEIINKKDE